MKLSMCQRPLYKGHNFTPSTRIFHCHSPLKLDVLYLGHYLIHQLHTFVSITCKQNYFIKCLLTPLNSLKWYFFPTYSLSFPCLFYMVVFTDNMQIRINFLSVYLIYRVLQPLVNYKKYL